MGSYCTTKYSREPRGFILYRREVPLLLYLLLCLMVYLSSIDCYFQQWRKNTKEELATPVLYPWCGIIWGPLHPKMARRACDATILLLHPKMAPQNSTNLVALPFLLLYCLVLWMVGLSTAVVDFCFRYSTYCTTSCQNWSLPWSITPSPYHITALLSANPSLNIRE